MGDNLSKPITEKHTTTFETPYVRVGCCGMQGWRRKMEDAHLSRINFLDRKDAALLGVYDGHNGQAIAKYCSIHMAEALMKTDAASKGDYEAAFKAAYMDLDETLMKSELRNEGGCTAVTCLMIDGKIYCANAGDSRAVLCRNGSPAIALSVDHKPSLPEEAARVEKAGGTISSNRVNGMLSLTRAIGDFDLKMNESIPLADQAISAFPDVKIIDQSADDQFLVLACDGIWDVLDNDEACELIKKSLEETKNDVGLVCERVLDKCLAPAAPGPGCDNMTIVIIQPKEEWRKRLRAQK